MNYQPKAGRCRACTKLWEDCSALPFHTMPVYRQDGTDAVVICNEFRKRQAGGSPTQERENSNAAATPPRNR